MKTILKTTLLLVASVGLVSCYDDYTDDFTYSTSQFIYQKPLRTVVPDRGEYTDIYVGVSIGGKREVDLNDQATFIIDETLLDGVSGKALMPANYYELGDPSTMRVRQANVPVADVKITFTEDFYADPLSLTAYYVIPFRITESTCDVIPEEKDYTMVCVKFVSSYSGTYYVRGKKTAVADADGTELPDGQVTEYYNNDISKNLTRKLISTGLNRLNRIGIAEAVEGAAVSEGPNAKYRVSLRLIGADEGSDYDYDVAVTTGDSNGAVPITHGEGKFYNAPFDVYETDKQARFTLSYIYQDGTNYFKVEEELIRRQDPYLGLRLEQW